MSRRSSLAEATVELTPLIDVVFLLLIFFMVSTTFIRESQIGIDLPGASGGPRAEAGAATIEIAVRRGGTYLVDGEPVPGDSLVALTTALRQAQALRQGTELRVAIVADARSTHQSVVRVLEAAGQAGMPHISLITRHPEDSETSPAHSSGSARQPGGGKADAG